MSELGEGDLALMKVCFFDYQVEVMVDGGWLCIDGIWEISYSWARRRLGGWR